MWYQESIFYQIYPFGFCNAPNENDGILQNRIGNVIEWIPHFKKIGIDAIYFCPVFSCDAHGYDTRDYTQIDCRLGSNADFAAVCQTLHDEGIRIVLDGVFNHVGRGFWAFEDVLIHKHASPYKDWFSIDFNRNNNYNDGLWYEGWEGHYNLVKLNLSNPDVIHYLFDCIQKWVDEFQIDGLRLDVAYLLNETFMRKLHDFSETLKPDFFLIGEMIHGDYSRIVNPSMLDSCTNYECFKGIYSSFNDYNMFEIAYSLNRQFNSQHNAIYKGLPLLNFVDNHDVNRIASNLIEENHLKPAYGLLFGMPGIPCIYYGSEWGVKGEKIAGVDDVLRPFFKAPQENAITEWISFLTQLRKEHPELCYGEYKQLYLTNHQFIFEREYNESKIVVAINADEKPYHATLHLDTNTLLNLQTEEEIQYDGKLSMEPFSAAFYKY